MTLTKLKEKGQITLPADIRKQLHVVKGDIFTCEVIDGKVVMTPQKLSPASQTSAQSNKVDISAYLGATAGTFRSADEIDTYIQNERDKWD